MKRIILLALMLLSFVRMGYCLEDKVVVVINDEVITQAEVFGYMNLLRLQMSKEDWEKSDLTNKKVLQNMIENRLIIQESKVEKVEVKDSEVESKVKQMKKSFASEDEFSQFLSVQGLTLSELNDKVREQLLIDRMISINIRSRIFISPKEITEYYDSHPELFYIPESVQVESISVSDKDKANDIYKQLNSGADFISVQEEYSEKANLGLVRKDQLKKDIEDTIFGLKTGEVSKPIKTEDGYYILLVKERIPAGKKELVEVQAGISNMLQEMKFNLQLQEWLNGLRKKAYILVKDEQNS